MAERNNNHLYLYLITGILLLSGLACGTLGGGAAPTEPAAVVDTVSTPTLAPTSTAPPADLLATEAAASAPTLAPTADGSLATETASGTGTGDNGGSDGGGSDGGSGDGGGSGNGGTSSSASCPAVGQNLLTNSSFEGQFLPYGAFVELNTAPPWTPWWKDGENNQRPEFKPAEAAIAPNRVHSGATSQQYFKSFGMFKSGVHQTVLNVPVGSKLQLSAYGQAWSCEEFSMCADGSSVNPSNMLMRVGIDPKGGANPFGNDIVWSAYFNPLDHWQVACVEAVSEAANVTVFLWASPDGPRQNQDVYWDDANLVVIP